MKSKTLKQVLIVFGLMIGALSLMSIIPSAAAAVISGGDQPTELSSITGGESSIRQLALRIVNYFLTFLGLIAVIMVIYGGITYVIAGGEEEKIGEAKKIIMYALVGLVIILLSFALVNTVLGAAKGESTV